MQEEEGKFGKFQLKVIPDYDLVRKMKQTLKFEVQGECYLRIPNPKYLQIFLFCLVARTNTIPKKKNVIVKKMKPGEQQEFNEAFVKYNDTRNDFNGPQELTKLAEKLNFHIVLIQRYHKQFTEDAIDHSISEFKRNEKILINYYKTQEDQPFYLKQIKIQAPQEIIYIIKQKDSLLLCSYSPKKFKGYQTIKRSSLPSRQSVEQIKEIQDLTELLPEQKKIQKPGNKSVIDIGRKESIKSQKTEQSQKGKKGKKESGVEKQLKRSQVKIQQKKSKLIQGQLKIPQEQVEEHQQQQEIDEQTEKQHSYFTYGLVLILILIIAIAFGGFQIPLSHHNPGTATTMQRLIDLIDTIKGT